MSDDLRAKAEAALASWDRGKGRELRSASDIRLIRALLARLDPPAPEPTEDDRATAQAEAEALYPISDAYSPGGATIVYAEQRAYVAGALARRQEPHQWTDAEREARVEAALRALPVWERVTVAGMRAALDAAEKAWREG